MKIILCANTAWSIYNFRFNLVVQLLSLGIEVIVLAPQDDSSEKLIDMGCTVYDLAMSAQGVNPFSDFKLLLRIISVYRRVKPDFVINYTIKPNIYGSIASGFLNIPSLAITTGLGYTFINNNLVAKIARLLYKFAFKNPKEIWFLNNDDLNIFLNYQLVEKDRAKLLHGEGIDTQYFTPRAHLNSDNNLRFLLIARMLWDKGIGEYVEAARIVKNKYPNAIFQLLGATGVANPSVISKENIDVWVKSGAVEYLGTTNDVRSLIAQADCVVLPSYREGIPRTMMEAASMAKPLIATNCVGCKDVIIDGVTGLFCSIKDSASLAQRMIQMIEMGEQARNTMGTSGREFMIDQFDEKKIINQYTETLINYGLIPSKKS
ncbi:glycosyltransferase family 4 protein [Iodobacter sp. CM08]|uniref:glycosyltransferase family 4 protein n=1 Tax=Iodobacter sp. CM08 TaxID=3085902 RepID=UPI002980A587|nr:glycosyltransferase family 4 protein [Iodobacter sp. CM08]MDW5416968.1 glycosyltransferase family 4 protein [Iodobacter sp. CM08]